METEIILEGFLKAEATHRVRYTNFVGVRYDGVCYTNFVGDGDSSIYPTLLSSVPVWGRDIKKN